MHIKEHMDINSIMRKLFILSFLTFIACACNRQEYEYSTAYVYKTAPYHWGRGYFKQQAYYRFEYDGKEIVGQFKYPQLGRIYSIHFMDVGDSLVVKYPRGKPHRNEVIRIIRNTPTKKKL